ncbi:MAG: PASTA domain-containing protein [Candidatus Aminicenantes bacterium]|nr:PASTA domain-containing protein [Candidatus Aminicenantes bacterium]
MSVKTSDVWLISILASLVVFFAAANAASEVILRGELVGLPDLIGRTLESARAELAAKKISLSIRDYVFDLRHERGRIVAQEPAPGSRVKPRRTIRVAVSQGSEQVVVPLCENRSFEWTVGALKTAGLRRGHLSRIHTSSHAAGRIIAQSPPAGAVVARATPVDFLVSQGEREASYIMPDLIGLRAPFVLSRLRALGFKVADVSHAYYPGLDSGLILKQSPVHGQPLLKRNEIFLEVSR